MVTSIARQSVILKCNMQCAYILGNYEFYYAAGLAGMLYGFDVPEDIRPKELGAFLAERLATVTPNGPQETHLVSRLKDYDPTEDYDEQMKEMLAMGQKETCLWQVSV